MQLTIRGVAVTIENTEVENVIRAHFMGHRPWAEADTLATRPQTVAIPRIGESWGGCGTYAGLTLHDNTPMHLVLLDGEAEDLTWAKAKDWANGLEDNAELPSRFDALVLFTNLRDKFQKTYYWTAAPDEPGYAWYQYFRYGTQHWDTVSFKLRARAVRRLPI